MKRLIVCALCLFLRMGIEPVSGQSALESSADPSFSRQGELRCHMLREHASFSTENVNILQAESESTEGRKNPLIGSLLSAVVPGAGEFYAGSWIKGAVFLGAEIALWIGYKSFSDKGQEWEDTFHAYADAHWSESAYRQWLDTHPEFKDTTHTLPSTKTQQYYEMIGKYDQFKGGWDDYEEGGTELTPNRLYYEDIRHKSNVQFKRASYCVMVVLGNHLLSAFDAAWTIRGINRRIETRMRMSLQRRGESYAPVLALHVNW